MSERGTILVVDDVPQNVRLLEAVLEPRGYDVVAAADGVAALALLESASPDLVVLDIVLPQMDGYTVCRRIRDREETAVLPIIMVTSSTGQGEEACDRGGRRRLRAEALRPARAADACPLATAHQALPRHDQVPGRRAPRAQPDPRGARSDTARGAQAAPAPTAVPLAAADRRDRLLGRRVDPRQFIEGDGVQLFFNDAIEVPDAPLRAVRLGCALREEMARLTSRWRKRGHDLDFGAGIALGYATCGEIGFEGRSDYAAIGAVTNLASRLADEASAGQILIDQRLYSEVEDHVDAEPIGEFRLKGFRRPVTAFDIVAVRRLDGLNEPKDAVHPQPKADREQHDDDARKTARQTGSAGMRTGSSG
jgi:adenylate cyclase